MSWNVVFWNIESGQSNKAIPGNPLEKNLEQIIETSNGLDALVLAEFKP
ncbi:MAG: hypothetical protein IT289_10275 [Oligoflexia bacterium]|nr:hypothetical protein [Oligoflexia bacterium]